MTSHEKARFIAHHYGYDAQSRQCIEETAELTQAINKFWRKVLDYGNKTLPDSSTSNFDLYMPFMTSEYENLIEELVDVRIMDWQMEELLGISRRQIREIIESKLDRQVKRIKEGMK